MKKHSLFLPIILLLVFLIGCTEVTDSPNVSPSKNNVIVTSSTPVNSTTPTDEPSASTPTPSDYVALVPTEMPAAILENNKTPQPSEVHSSDAKQADSIKEQAPPTPTENKASNTDSGITTNPPVETAEKTEVETAEKTETEKITVYITEDGEKYHSDGCQYLKKSKIPMSLNEAKNQGYTPCKRCKPPQ
ncbi:MAG: hypothetical protein GX383_05885 [Clostridium sp.]|nr:hypothetical protein [Clostridium sp.]